MVKNDHFPKTLRFIYTLLIITTTKGGLNVIWWKGWPEIRFYYKLSQKPVVNTNEWSLYYDEMNRTSPKFITYNQRSGHLWLKKVFWIDRYEKIRFLNHYNVHNSMQLTKEDLVTEWFSFVTINHYLCFRPRIMLQSFWLLLFRLKRNNVLKSFWCIYSALK